VRIAYVHQYFKTPAEPGSTRSYHIAQELLASGHEVVMISGRKEGQRQLVERRKVDGIELWSIRNPYSNRMGGGARLLSFLRFTLLATLILLRQRRTDLLIATSTPLSVGVPALLFHWFRGRPFVFEVRDLWPAAPIQLGVVRSPLAKRVLIAFERLIYRKAAHVIALSPGMAEGVIATGISTDRVTVIPNMGKADLFQPSERDEALARELGFTAGSFRVIHFGAMGKANGLDYVLQAAKIMQDRGDSRVQFLLLGDGSERDRLEAEARACGLDSVIFKGKVSMVETARIVNLCDASVVTFVDLPILGTNSPNKLFDSLSAGLPVIVNSRGWTRDLIEGGGCGAFVDPTRPEDLVRLLELWAESPEAVQRMGRQARRLGVEEFDRTVLCPRFVALIEKVQGSR